MSHKIKREFGQPFDVTWSRTAIRVEASIWTYRVPNPTMSISKIEPAIPTTNVRADVTIRAMNGVQGERLVEFLLPLKPECPRSAT